MVKFLIFFLVFYSFIYSNQPTVKTTVDTKEVLIGEAINFNIEISSSKEYQFILPDFKDTLSNFEIIEKGKIDTTLTETKLIYKQNIKLISFDSGYFEIPSLKILYHLKSDSSKFIDYRSISTNKHSITVNTIAIDTTETFKDIKPIVDVPFSIWEIIEYIYLLIAIIILSIIGYYIYKKYFKNKIKIEEDLPYDPKIPADILAIEALKKLQNEKLWQNGEYKEYYTKLTDILRIYIYRVFEFDARDMTSSEILEHLKLKYKEEEIIHNLKYILENADLVKFAKEKPYQDINFKVIELAYNFVEKTRILIAKNEDEE